MTKVPLDYEKIKQYKLRLYVTDLGDLVSDDDMESGLLSGLGIETEYESVTDLPSDHVDYIDLVINVIDENDNAPKFVGGVTDYSYDVDEEKPAHTFVGFANVSYVLQQIINHKSTLDYFENRQPIVILVCLVQCGTQYQELIMRSKRAVQHTTDY